MKLQPSPVLEATRKQPTTAAPNSISLAKGQANIEWRIGSKLAARSTALYMAG
jgi:hypothetical protein